MDANYVSTNSEPHYLTVEDKKNFASKGVAGTALGLGIAGTALSLLSNGGSGILSGLFGNNYNNGYNMQRAGLGLAGAATLANVSYEERWLERKETNDYIDITKNYYENKIANLRELTESFYALDQKIQAAKDVAAFESRANFDALNKRIIDLEKSDAVQKATQPLYQVINDLRLNNVNQAAQAGIASANANAKNMVENLGIQTNSAITFEAERRRCADNTIVNYANSTFYPKYIADITTATTTTKQPIYNPLMPPTPTV